MAKNPLIKEQLDGIEDQAGIMARFQRVLEAVTAANKAFKDSFNGQSAHIAEVTASTKENADATDKATNSTNNATEAVDKAAKSNKNLAAKLGVAAAGVFGLKSAFFGTIGVIKNSAMAIFGIIGALGKFAMAIITFPFRLLSGIIAFANQYAGDVTLIMAIEEVRKQFGNLATNEARSVMESFRDLRRSSGDLADSGLSLRRVFGGGQAGLAAAVNFLRENAEALGARFSVLHDQFNSFGDELVIFNKGMGLSGEQFAGLATRAISSGRHIGQVLFETANLSLQLGERFGINAKLISRDMADMASDFQNFGSLSQQELATTAVYARKLGLEIKDLQGVIGTFDNFADAATNAAKLAQAFGANVDALEMLNTEDSAKRIDMLRQSFFAAGHSIENLDRQERALLATTTGLTGSALEMAFAQRNIGLSYDNIATAVQDAGEAPLSTEQSMSKLADSINRVYEVGESFTSFWDAFTKGFAKGLAYFSEWRQVFRQIRRSLQETHFAARQLAADIVHFIPGLHSLRNALLEIFAPGKMRQFIQGFKDPLIDLFTNLNPDNGSSAVGRFFVAIKRHFRETFGQSGDTIINLLKDSFKTALGFFGQFIVGIIPEIMRGMTAILNGIAGFFRGDFSSWIANITSPIGLMFVEAFKGLGDAFTQNLPALVTALKSALWAVFDRVKPWLMTAMYVLGGLFVARAIIAGTIAGLASTLSVSLLAAGFSKLKDLVVGMFSGLTDVGEAADSAKLTKVIDDGAGLKTADILKAAGNLLLAAIVFIPAAAAFATGIGIAYLLLKSNGILDDPAGLLLTFAAIGTGILATIGLVLAGNMLASVSKGMPTAIAGLIAAAGFFILGIPLFVLALAGAMWVADKVFAGKSISEVAAFTTLMTGAMFAAVGLTLAAVGIGALIAGTLGAAALSALAGVGLMGAVLVAMTGVLAETFKNLDSALIGVDPDRVEQSIRIFGNLLTSMQPMADILVAAMSLERINATQLTALIKTIGDTFTAVFVGMSTMVSSIIDSMSGTGLTEEQFRKAEAVTSIISAFGGLISAFPEPFTLLNNQIRQYRRSGATPEQILAITNTSAQLKSNMDTVMSAIVDNLPSLSSGLTQIASMEIPEGGLDKIVAVTEFLGSMSQVISNLVINRTNSAGQTSAAILTTNEAVSMVNALAQFAEQIHTKAPELVNNISGAAAAFATITEAQLDSTLNTIKGVAETYNEIYEIFNNLGAANIDVALDNFADAVGTGRSAISIHHQPVTVTVNVNVRMDANQIASVLTGDSSISTRTINSPTGRLARISDVSPGRS